MKIYVYVRQEEAILAGSEKYGVMETTVDVSKLSERQRKAFASLGSNTSLNLDTGIVSEETIVAALDRMATKTEKDAAEKATQVEAAIRKFLEMPQQEFNEKWIPDWGGESEAVKSPLLADKMAIRKAFQKAQKEAKEQADADAKRKDTEYRAKKDAAADVLKALRKTEREVWAAEHGSERLKLCIAGNYSCNKLYLEERVLLELGEGWEVDTKDTAEIEYRANPSLEALKIVAALPKGFVGEIVWMTCPPNYNTGECEGECEFEDQEAVWVKGCPFTDVNIYKLM